MSGDRDRMVDFYFMQAELVIDACKKEGVFLPCGVLDKLALYISEIVAWNKRHNLISFNDINIIGQRHILDSIVPLLAVSFSENDRLLDIGSGAGFPAIPLKIMRPDLNVTLVESRRKKVLFLRSTASLLDFSDFLVRWSRIEEFESKDDFDIVTTRAMAAPEKFGNLVRVHLRKGGLIILYLGPNDSRRLNAIVASYKNEGYTKLIFVKSPFTEKDFNILILKKS